MPIPTVPLSWERKIDDAQVSQNAHPERAAWSAHLCGLIDQNYAAFTSADDIKIVIPDFRKLNRDQIITKLGELFARVAEYESSWDPACTSQDVNGNNAPDYLATGFYQLNVHDQAAFQTGTTYTANELKDPLNNINCGVKIALYLIQKMGRLTYIHGIHHGFFFETLLFDALDLTVHKILRDVWFLDTSPPP